VAACLDALAAGLLAPGQADTARTAVAGHSFGAFTTLLVAGARLDAEGLELTMADDRPRAFLALSPPGLGERGLHPGSLSQIARPVLLAFGSTDEGPRG
jgi:predicted dienelactone hydrolase